LANGQESRRGETKIRRLGDKEIGRQGDEEKGRDCSQLATTDPVSVER
jgi:hypothetical protein